MRALCWQGKGRVHIDTVPDPKILNQSISINGHPFTVIGVAPPGFHSIVGGDSPAVFVPMTMKLVITPDWNDLEERRSRWLNIVGRVKPELSREQAQAGLDSLWHSIRADELKQLSDERKRADHPKLEIAGAEQ